MDMAQLEQDINLAWEDRDSISAVTTGAVRDAVDAMAVDRHPDRSGLHVRRLATVQ